ncbi:type III-B CRISPR module RAMP protein Cmr1 [Aquifex aeolicus]|uniref:CRISPR type III-associated protein domain-containing protein n=1 Tax=Aquifex aeolicus (strain VF5) TaxID=224324 RepID=O66703_AQUAE|nr:type III-B CRISPR module RAMP protein Cmr1 [Aquifex aeolicus]AAC06663.1 putative protein [Aquifex aeolicus VF5]
MKKEHQKTLTFEIITPVVMAGTYKDEPELRIPSIKGMLRWWFRFFYASHNQSIDKLREHENEIFGSTEKACQFYMHLKYSQKLTDAYLAMNKRYGRYNNIKRKALEKNDTFRIDFIYSPFFTYKKELNTTLQLLSFLGGIGARWRRGFGSIQLKNGEDYKSFDKLKEKIEKVLKGKGEYHHDGFININNVDIYLVKPKRDNFWIDSLGAMNNLRKKVYKEFKSETNIKAIACKPKGGSRAVSPLIIQIKKFSEGKFYGILIVYNEWDKYEEFKNFINNNSELSFEQLLKSKPRKI